MSALEAADVVVPGVLDGASLAVRPGEVVALTAPSGAGKTTLLRACVRLVPVAGGRITLGGEPVEALDPRALRRRVALVAQAPVMLPGTVAENLRHGVRDADVAGALRTAGLDPGFADREAAGLSGGERARVAVARALTRAPEVLLLDEPTAALDARAAEALLTGLRAVAARGTGVCLTTHDRGIVERWADREARL